MAYSDENDVYEATGLNSSLVQNLSGKTAEQVTTLINGYIAKADQRIKRLLKVPITVRKELHLFNYNKTIELGPHEDEFEFFGGWNPENCVEKVYALFTTTGDNDYRVKLPYPKDCDELTEDVTDMTGTNATLTKDTTTKKCGTASVKAVFSAAGNFYFPQNTNMKKNIEPWKYISFWFRTDDKTVTFTLTLYDKDGNSTSETFTLNFNDTWEIVTFDIEEVLSDIDWGTTELQKIEISADGACTCYFDNFNFNDGYFWTCPEGLICWADPDSTPQGRVRLTYSYDPYKVTVPDDLLDASAKLAGVKLLDYVIGLRVAMHGFKQMTYDLDAIPDKIALETTRTRLAKEVASALAGIGYGTHEGIGVA